MVQGKEFVGVADAKKGLWADRVTCNVGQEVCESAFQQCRKRQVDEMGLFVSAPRSYPQYRAGNIALQRQRINIRLRQLV